MAMAAAMKSESLEREGARMLGSAIRSAFPIYRYKGATSLHYLDSAASAQKPAVVIDRLAAYLSKEHANIHRGAYALSAHATDSYDRSKEIVSRFIGASGPGDIVFTKGATEAINLVSYGIEPLLAAGDNVVVTLLEHHSNIVPWQLLEKRRGVKLHFAPLTDQAEVILDQFAELIQRTRPKLVAMAHVANSFGTLLPLEEMIGIAKSAGAAVLVDAAQSVQHCQVEVRRWGADFVAFSGHKLYGPTGIGVLYVAPSFQDRLQPVQGGGDMIERVTVEGSTFAPFPQRFEAGTPPIAEAIALGTAVEFVQQLGISNIYEYEAHLFREAWELMRREKGVTLYGPATLHGAGAGRQVSIISFNVDGVHAHDLSTIADSFGVQIRAGHHCAMPALKRLGIASSARASIGIYSDLDDFHALIEAIRAARTRFR